VSNSNTDNGPIILTSGSNGIVRLRSRVSDKLVARNINPREVIHGVFFSSIWVPACVSGSFSRNGSVLGVGNGAPKRSKVRLVALRGCCSRIRAHVMSQQGKGRTDNPRKVVG